MAGADVSTDFFLLSIAKRSVWLMPLNADDKFGRLTIALRIEINYSLTTNVPKKRAEDGRRCCSGLVWKENVKQTKGIHIF
jgi:hypothetical protein